MKRWLIGLALLGMLCLTRPAWCQASAANKAAAHALFDQGKRLFAEDRFEEACPKFQASHELDPGLGTLLFLGDRFEEVGKTASAWATFKEAQDVATKEQDADRNRIGELRAVALEPRLSKSVLRIDPSLKTGGVSPADPKLSACEMFCQEAEAACTETNKVYASKEVCLDVCLTFNLGQPTDRAGSSVFCRLNNLRDGQLTGELSSHCPIAGPGGGGICGSDCDNYWDLMFALCPRFFGTRTDCTNACALVPTVGRYNVSIEGGNSVECRLYHVSAAIISAIIHCPHAAGEAICK